eukprot:5903708-Amphidinium_carterae.1
MMLRNGSSNNLGTQAPEENVSALRVHMTHSPHGCPANLSQEPAGWQQVRLDCSRETPLLPAERGRLG